MSAKLHERNKCQVRIVCNGNDFLFPENLGASGIFTKPSFFPNPLVCGALPSAKISINFS